MAPANNQGNISAIIVLLAIIFVAGGYLTSWWIKQKIIFNQSFFWFSFYIFLILIVSSLVFFIWFLLKEKEEYSYYTYYNSNEILDKPTVGWISLICFFVAIIFFFMMINAYQKGFSDKAIQDLAEAQGKLNEFNYIRDVLTGVEIERLMTENFDSAMQDICKNQNYDCEQLTKNYQSVRDIVEAKESADNVVKFFGIKDTKT